ncbi:MAG TPA: NIPSNAP family protein [Candidatus Binatia bacterium]|nr:NIPSNAP family protein [Candidatus Binatia bacterium]
MNKAVEIRSYNLKPGRRDEFHRLVLEASLPMLKRWDVDVVDFGPSPHDNDSYYLIRAYDSLEHRRASQDAFYGSAEWKQGPREKILALIDSDTSIVIEMDSGTVDSFRRRTK